MSFSNAIVHRKKKRKEKNRKKQQKQKRKEMRQRILIYGYSNATENNL